MAKGSAIDECLAARLNAHPSRIAYSGYLCNPDDIREGRRATVEMNRLSRCVGSVVTLC